MKSEHAAEIGISDLARLSRTTRSTLLHYDRIGLLKPAGRNEKNNYRYYRQKQIQDIRVISVFLNLGYKLSQISEIIKERTPDKICSIIQERDACIDDEIANLQTEKRMLKVLNDLICGGMAAERCAIHIEKLNSVSILLGPQIDYSDGKTTDDALVDFCNYAIKAQEQDPMHYPIWAVLSKEHLESRQFDRPDHFFFVTPAGLNERPAGTYLTGYTRGYYGQGASLYNSMLDYAEKHGLSVIGPAWETYPLNEISITEPDNYLIRISFMISNAVQ
ncbi:MAG: MerR family transcriptional regulator [Clostridiales Family XIII bacterium]|jgi:DNA-binding transcriptional MerR regulator/effector-binding domain-containing protein|nr:MerR family transcriptional regulator [Clostridiales Family XIII bacterium]